MKFSRQAAKTQRMIAIRRFVFAPLRLCGMIFVSMFILFNVQSIISAQVPSQDTVLPGPRNDLVAVHFPDLSKLEARVRDQITTLQNSLTEVVQARKIDTAQLSEAYGELGQTYHAYALVAPARECYRNAGVLAPNDFRWIYLPAVLDQQEGRFDEAVSRYRAARNLRPDYVAAVVNLGNIFLELNRLQEALENFGSALKLDENNAAAEYGLGQVALSKHNYAEAIQHFEKTLARVPGANRVHYSLAMAYRGLGDAAKARAHLAQQGPVGVRVADPLLDGLRDEVTGERLHLARGKLAFESKRYAEAVAEFRKAVAANSNSVTARINLGASLSQTGDVAGAIEQFEAALRIEPEKVNAHFNLAVLLVQRDEHDKAITHLRAALSVEPDDLTIRLLLARELSKSGKPAEALPEFLRVVQADPNNEGALLDLVKLLYRQGRFKEALAALEKSHAQYPQKGATAVLLAYMLAAAPEHELRDGVRALDLAQRIYEASNAVEYGTLVALALAELGRCREASEWQQRMIAVAEQRNDNALLEKLKGDLKLYARGGPCRPPLDASLEGLLFFRG